jgi:hypothetical protein
MTLALHFKDLTAGVAECSEYAISVPDYVRAEQQLTVLLATDSLDSEVRRKPEIVSDFEEAITVAVNDAYCPHPKGEKAEAAHLFLQRVLYRINRLNLFWYDDLQHYKNERSLYLGWCSGQIEQIWQAWELTQLGINVEQLKALDVKEALRERGDIDLNPLLTPNKCYLREQMSLEGYRHLLAITSLDGLVEASRMSRIIGGASNEIQATLIRVLLEEYGNGRFCRKHSTFFANMMAELNLDTVPESYFELVPWEILAAINHNFLLTECKRHFLRYNGGLTYFEIVGPSIYTDYLKAAQRLECSEGAMGYWELHIREDERHGQWMLNDVALPLVEQYPQDAWELLLGYDQERAMGDRAGTALVRCIRHQERADIA